jgi:antitoxin MazE
MWCGASGNSIDNVDTQRFASLADYDQVRSLQGHHEGYRKEVGQQRLGTHPGVGDGGARLSLDQAVDVREESGRIVIEPIRGEAFDLGDLVADITDENRHDSVDFGAPVGREVW